jgi:hypothetical protein
VSDKTAAEDAPQVRPEWWTMLDVRHVISISTHPPRPAVDILLDGKLEEDLGYNWVEDSSEAISEAG